MAIELGSAYGKVIIDSSGATKGIKEAAGATRGLNDVFRELTSINLVTAGTLAGLVGGLKFAIDAASEGQLTVTRLNSVLKATGGVVGMTSDELVTMAEDLAQVTGVGHDLIINAEAILLTFRNIGHDVFPETIQAALDMKAVLGTDLQSAVIMLGKALNDPEQGLTALKRAGVSFTESQIAQIKTLQESGRTMEAQKLILKEMELEFGGAAKAAGDTFAGKVGKLKDSLDELGETLGGPVIDGLGIFADGINKVVKAFSDLPVPVQQGAAALLLLKVAGPPAMLLFGNLLKLAPGVITFFGSLGPLGIAAAAGVAVAVAAVKDLDNVVERGISDVDKAWKDYFARQIAQGKSAAEIADAYAKKEAEINKIWNERGDIGVEIGKAYTRMTKDEEKFLSNQSLLQETLWKTSKDFDEYWRAMVKASGGNADLGDSGNVLIKIIKEKAQADWDAAHATDASTDAVYQYTYAFGSAINPANDYNKVMRDYANILDAGANAAANFRAEQEKLNAAEMSRVQAGISGQLKQAVGNYKQGMDDLAKKRQELEGKMKELGATDFLPALDIKKIGQYQSQLTGLWVSVHDLNMKRKEGEELNDEEQATWDATMDKVGALKNKITDLGGVPYLTPDQRKELEDLRKQYGACDEEAKQLADALRKATNEMIFQRASADLDAKATLELGRALGVISEEDYAVATVLDGLNKATASTDPGAYAAQVKAIADAIDRLHNKDIEVTVTTIQNEIITGGGAGGSEHRTPTTPTGHRGYASGVTNFAVPPGYPNDSFMVGLTSGEILNVLPAGQTTTQSMIVNVPITVYGEADVPTIKQAAYDGANRGMLAAMRERGMR